MPIASRAAVPAIESEINVTPMIDVLLVLLIIYLMQGRFAMPATLPPPGTPAGRAAPPELVLDLEADGGFVLDGRRIPAAALAGTLREIYARRPAKLLFIHASAERSYQDVIDAMDLARGAGVQVLALMPANSAP
jgi:biopolymer transport protein ExbD